MHVFCDRDLLAPVFCSISRMAKNEVSPLSSAVLLTATSVPGQEQGILRLVGLGLLGTVGLLAQLPATVQEEGSTLVRISLLTEYIEALRSGRLTLRQEQTISSLAGEPSHGLSLAMPEKAAPLLVERVSTSDAGTRSTNTARFQAWSSIQYPLPPVSEWGSTPVFTCTFSSALFKKALAACAPFAREGARLKGSSYELSGVLLRLDAHSLTLSATTGTMLIAHRLLLEEPAPCSLTGLFEGKALFWIQQALPTAGRITCALMRERQTQKLVLLLSTRTETWFCRSMDASCPSWEALLHLPHEAELVIKRGELKNPVKFFAKATELSEGIALTTEGTALRMSTVPSLEDTIHAAQTLPLVSASADFTVLVNPQQFSRLVRLTEADLLHLEMGRVVRGTKVIGFLRTSSERIQVMMSLSREEPQEESVSPSHSPERASVPGQVEPAMTS